ncbi:hypothetical protein PQO01_16915 [Lentisphaera marina]|uniref:hypothetical protein n=1 Tax=Lentisphaera marina TaxID=1111041 RepID=UPI002366E0EE|nr:hypothetical protein [Lentisphaera marina]MDD7986635.1 hypothetical protein [Lentisphaera marina]
MATVLKSNYILEIKQSQRRKIDKEILNLESLTIDVESKYAQIHKSMKGISYGLKGSLARWVKSAQDYSTLLIQAQSIKLYVDEIKNMGTEKIKYPPIYMTKREKIYYELMINYHKAIAHSIEIIISNLQIMVFKKQGLNHQKTSKVNYNSNLNYYLASRLNCKKIAAKLAHYKSSVTL